MSNLWVPKSYTRRKQVWRDASSLVAGLSWLKGMLSVEGVVSDDGLRGIIAHERYGDDPREWVHVSVSRADRWPSWDELMVVKDEFIFHCVDGDVMPH